VNLQKRLRPLALEARGDLISIKSGLERWFDETMQRTEGAYKRWATSVLFVVGLLLAVGGNVSTVHVAEQLWQSPVTRQAVVDAASKVVSQGSPPSQLNNVAATTNQLQVLSLPIGWDQTQRGSRTATFAGWLLTALLIMLGGPFWYDLLTRLVPLRSSGTKPPEAADDPASATRAGLASAGSPDAGTHVVEPATATPARRSRQRTSSPPPTGDKAQASLAKALGTAATV
jgi:hypothetical protein